MQLTNLWSWLSGGQPRRSGHRLGKRRHRSFRPVLNRLEDRTVPAGYIATGAGLGAIPEVSIRVDIRNSLTGGQNPPGSGQLEPAESDGKTDLLSQVFTAYNPAFRGGVNVAAGNFDGDYRTPDSLVTAPLAGGGPHVIVWRMKQLADGRIVTDGILDQFMAYDPRFGGGVNLTTGDLDGDGLAELITAPASNGGPHVKVYSFNATTNHFELKTEFMAYDPIFQGGVSIASSQGYSTAV